MEMIDRWEGNIASIEFTVGGWRWRGQMVRGRQAEITEAGVTIHHGFGLSSISGFNAKLSS
jgi:hypothetical protein